MPNKDYHETAIRRSGDSFLAAARKLPPPKNPATWEQIKAAWKAKKPKQ